MELNGSDLTYAKRWVSMRCRPKDGFQCDVVLQEQAILKQKLVVMDQHLERKSAEAHRKLLQQASQ
eukprot:4106817-Amphidinium_carterae.1